MWIIRWSSCSFSRKLPLRLIILDSFFAFTLVIVTPLCKTELSRKRNRWIRTSSAGKVIQVNLFHHVTGSCGLSFLNVAVREANLNWPQSITFIVPAPFTTFFFWEPTWRFIWHASQYHICFSQTSSDAQYWVLGYFWRVWGINAHTRAVKPFVAIVAI